MIPPILRSISLIACCVMLLLAATSRVVGQSADKADEIVNTILEDGAKGSDSDKAKQPDPAEIKKGDVPVDAKPVSERKDTPAKKAEAESAESKPAVSRDEEVLYKTGVDFYHSGMYDNALAKFQELLAKYPQGTFKESAHFWLGKVAMKRYRYDDALKEFSAVTEASGDYPAALFLIAQSNQLKGRPVAAIEYYQKVAARFPSHELADDALLAMGKLYATEGKGVQAIDAAMRIMKHYKDRETVPDAMYLIGKIYERDPQVKDPETARRIYRRFLKKADTDDLFRASPLKRRVQEDLRHIEDTYFKMER